jgi:hypothetical protein
VLKAIESDKAEVERKKRIQQADMISRLGKNLKLEVLCPKLRQQMLRGGGRFDNALELLRDIKRGKFDLESDIDERENQYQQP